MSVYDTFLKSRQQISTNQVNTSSVYEKFLAEKNKLAEVSPVGIEATDILKGVETAFPSTAGKLKQIGKEIVSGYVPTLNDVKQAPEKVVGTIVNSIQQEKKNIQNYWETAASKAPVSEKVSAGLKMWAGGMQVLFSPISAFFVGAEQIPGLRAVSQLVTLPFDITGDIGGDTARTALNALPIPQKDKDNLEEAVNEIGTLAGQIALGGRIIKEISPVIKERLVGKYGEKGADVIIKKATEKAKITDIKPPKEIAKPEIKPEIKPEVKPVEVKPAPKIAPEAPIKPTEALKAEKGIIPQELQPLAQEARKSKDINEFIRKIATDTYAPEFRNPLADAWRAKYIQPLQKGSKPSFSSDPIMMEKNLDNFLERRFSAEKLANMSVRQKSEIVNGKQWADLYSEMLDNNLMKFQQDFYTQAVKGVSPTLPKAVGVVEAKAIQKVGRGVGEVKPTKISARAEAVKPLEPIGEGKVKVSGLAKGVEAKVVEKKLTDTLGDLPEYRQLNMKEQAKMATDLVAQDFERAKSIAKGEMLPPKDLLPESVFMAVEDYAIKNGDIELLRELATSPLTTEATAMGQRIRALAERNPDTAVAKMQEIIKIKEEKVAKKYKKPAKEVKSEITKKIKESIKTADKWDWNNFIKSIQC